MPSTDNFETLARYYDAIMAHIRYERWFAVISRLTVHARPPIRHLDAGCGTGTLMGLLRQAGCESYGLDLSPAMLAQARRSSPHAPLVNADLRALPFLPSFDLVTCLFDTINFLLDYDSLKLALAQLAQTLNPGGLLYFDAITERMVREHFAGQQWTEDNGPFSTSWDSRYVPESATSETTIRVNSGPASLISERIYSQSALKAAIEAAGLHLLGMVDAETWHAPGKDAVRLDVVACKQPTPAIRKRFKAITRDLRECCK